MRYKEQKRKWFAVWINIVTVMYFHKQATRSLKYMVVNIPVQDILAPWILNLMYIFLLTHWGRDKMATISQMTYSNACS